MAVNGDLLSALSLAFAALAVFYSLWWPDIESATSPDFPKKFADRRPNIVKQTAILRSKAQPIAVASIAVSLLTAPPAVDVFVQFARSLANSGWQTFAQYNAIEALFVAVWIGTIWIGASALRALKLVRVGLRAMRDVSPTGREQSADKRDQQGSP